jgi:hypothetical protein
MSSVPVHTPNPYSRQMQNVCRGFILLISARNVNINISLSGTSCSCWLSLLCQKSSSRRLWALYLAIQTTLHKISTGDQPSKWRLPFMLWCQSTHHLSMEKDLHVIRIQLSSDPSFLECSFLRVEDVMKLITISSLSINSIRRKRLWQWETCCLVVSNIFMEQCEETALDTAGHKPTKWFRYVNYLSFGHMDQQEIQTYHQIYLYRALTVYNFKSNHPYHTKRRVVHSLVSLAEVIWQDQDFTK